ncbi:hypothetical protein PFTANZ_04293 [Plasmodium falciparum Tanzania (2000708)]|uniref:Uncharacterized protein n=1 Tax=Plasmodium falciparum Tanzania (2000708) TaxID=1036725 RepID=A0A024W3D4_PLAFA|nr:hypothetical protein PFTANZ_04293 [Plasmodium falciparum Tanzania (2000708)]
MLERRNIYHKKGEGGHLNKRLVTKKKSKRKGRYTKTPLNMLERNNKNIKLLITDDISRLIYKNEIREKEVISSNDYYKKIIRSNNYVVRLHNLYNEFKLDDCLNYGLENLLKLKKNDYISKVEFLRIIGNIYFQIEKYKYSAITYMLLCNILNRIDYDEYKVELCYNAGVVFIKCFLQYNDINFYINAKNALHYSLIYNDKKNNICYNEHIYDNTLLILKHHFPNKFLSKINKKKKLSNLFKEYITTTDESLAHQSSTYLSDLSIDQLKKKKKKNQKKNFIHLNNQQDGDNISLTSSYFYKSVSSVEDSTSRCNNYCIDYGKGKTSDKMDNSLCNKQKRISEKTDTLKDKNSSFLIMETVPSKASNIYLNNFLSYDNNIERENNNNINNNDININNQHNINNNNNINNQHNINNNNNINNQHNINNNQHNINNNHCNIKNQHDLLTFPREDRLTNLRNQETYNNNIVDDLANTCNMNPFFQSDSLKNNTNLMTNNNFQSVINKNISKVSIIPPSNVKYNSFTNVTSNIYHNVSNNLCNNNLNNIFKKPKQNVTFNNCSNIFRSSSNNYFNDSLYKLQLQDDNSMNVQHIENKRFLDITRKSESIINNNIISNVANNLNVNRINDVCINAHNNIIENVSYPIHKNVLMSVQNNIPISQQNNFNKYLTNNNEQNRYTDMYPFFQANTNQKVASDFVHKPILHIHNNLPNNVFNKSQSYDMNNKNVGFFNYNQGTHSQFCQPDVTNIVVPIKGMNNKLLNMSINKSSSMSMNKSASMSMNRLPNSVVKIPQLTFNNNQRLNSVNIPQRGSLNIISSSDVINVPKNNIFTNIPEKTALHYEQNGVFHNFQHVNMNCSGQNVHMNIDIKEKHSDINIEEKHKEFNIAQEHFNVNISEEHINVNMSEEHINVNMSEEHINVNMPDHNLKNYSNNYQKNLTNKRLSFSKSYIKGMYLKSEESIEKENKNVYGKNEYNNLYKEHFIETIPSQDSSRKSHDYDHVISIKDDDVESKIPMNNIKVENDKVHDNNNYSSMHKTNHQMNYTDDTFLNDLLQDNYFKKLYDRNIKKMMEERENASKNIFAKNKKKKIILNILKKVYYRYEHNLSNEYYNIYKLKNQEKKNKFVVKNKTIVTFLEKMFRICKRFDENMNNKIQFIDTYTYKTKKLRKVQKMKNLQNDIYNNKYENKNKCKCKYKHVYSLDNLEKYHNKLLHLPSNRKQYITSNYHINEDQSINQSNSKQLIIKSNTSNMNNNIKFNSFKEKNRVLKRAAYELSHNPRYVCDKGNYSIISDMRKEKRQRQYIEHMNKDIYRKDVMKDENLNYKYFIKLYNEIRNDINDNNDNIDTINYSHMSNNCDNIHKCIYYEEKLYREKKEIEDIVHINSNKYNKKLIRDKVKKLSSYNNPIINNISDKFIYDVEKIFLMKQYSYIIKGLRKNENIKHIYYLYQNMYDITYKLDHMNSSNFFNISSYIIDILLLSEIKEKDILKKKINKIKYSYRKFYTSTSNINMNNIIKRIMENMRTVSGMRNYASKCEDAHVCFNMRKKRRIIKKKVQP